MTTRAHCQNCDAEHEQAHAGYNDGESPVVVCTNCGYERPEHPAEKPWVTTL